MTANHERRRELITAQFNSAQSAANYESSTWASGHEGQFFRSRIRLVQDVLAANQGGDLLDAGCGPGLMAQVLFKSRPHDFRITILDQSPAMMERAATSTRDLGEVGPVVGQLEAMPFAEVSFDVALVMGALEYADARAALREISRVTRQGGSVVVTMLNPLSLYRFGQWFLYWPLCRAVGVIETLVGVPSKHRHGVPASGIRAFPAGRLRRMMTQAGLEPVDLIYYDVTPLVPPFDRFSPLARLAKFIAPQSAATSRWGHWLASSYLISAKRA